MAASASSSVGPSSSTTTAGTGVGTTGTVGTTPPQQFCVRWNSYQSNLQNAFPKLLNSEHFVDVTLACENEMLKCHKVVLSACSTYFEKLLLDNPCQHPIIFMKDMKFHEVQSLVDFMYKGEVNVTQDDLPSLLKSAEALQIRGLCGSDQLLNQQQFGALKSQNKQASNSTNNDCKIPTDSPRTQIDTNYKNNDRLEGGCSSEGGNNQSSSECDSNDGVPMKDDGDYKEEGGEDDSYYEGDNDLMDTEFLEEDNTINTNDMNKTPEFAIANVSCQYDGSPGSATNRRIRRSDEELRRAAECITRGQTFQTVSDQFNIPISTIRFYMARKGILPRRKRGRACSGPTGGGGGGGVSSGSGIGGSGGGGGGGGGGVGGVNNSFNSVTSGNNHHHHHHHSTNNLPVSTSSSYNSPGNTSPVGPPYHIVHYKLPALGVSKLK